MFRGWWSSTRALFPSTLIAPFSAMKYISSAHDAKLSRSEAYCLPLPAAKTIPRACSSRISSSVPAGMLLSPCSKVPSISVMISLIKVISSFFACNQYTGKKPA